MPEQQPRLVVGKYYDVTHVRARWHKRWSLAKPRWFPVHGRMHTDHDLGFPWRHWHVDARFLDSRLRWAFGPYLLAHEVPMVYIVPIQLQNLSPEGVKQETLEGFRYSSRKKEDLMRELLADLPREAWIRTKRVRTKRVRMKRDWPLCRKQHFLAQKLRCSMEGAKLDLTTMKCPHRGADLANAPVVDGLIHCPLHGMLFDRKTGESVWPENYYSV